MADDNQHLVITGPRRQMAIKNLFPQLPERGKIKIGKKGPVRQSGGGRDFQPPVKLDHFIVTSLTRGEDGNFLPDKAIMDKLGPKPTEIPIRLIYDDPTLNFPTRYACYIGRALWCSGDGEVAVRMTTTTQEMTDKARVEPRQVQCPCHRQDPAYDGKDKCKMNGKLGVLIDGAGGVGGVHTFRTTSYNSIVGLMSSQGFIKSVTGGVLANLPLKLRITGKQAQSPDGNAVSIFIVGIEYDGTLDSLQDLAHGIALHRAKTHVSIEHIETEAKRLLALAPPANAVLPGDDPDDVVAEFYPEQAATADNDDFGAPEPPRARDLRPPQQGQGLTRTADLVEKLGESGTLPDVPLYTLTDCDGVITESDNLSAAGEQLHAIFVEAHRRGPSHVAAARENNEALIGEIGEPQIPPAGGSPQDRPRQPSSEAAPSSAENAPRRTPTGDRPTNGAPAGPAARDAGVTSTASSPGRSSIGERQSPPRSAIWSENSYAVALRNANGGPDWPRWVNDMAFLAQEADDTEFEKLKADNRDTMQRLKVTDGPQYTRLSVGLQQARKSPIDG